jgi:GABA permease
LILLTLTNIFSVRSYGEFEYWFASIKVAAIVLFLIIGGLYVLGWWPGAHLNFSNLTHHGGFTPFGTLSLFAGVTTVIFSFFGSEIVTIAASESKEPQQAVARATNSVIWRVLIFYVGAIFLIVTILPWNDNHSLVSPFVSVLQVIGIPGAVWIMNLVVVTAVLSCLNSGLYTASRMLFALANQGNAPKSFVKLNRRGVPVTAILICTGFGYLSVAFDYISPQGVFAFLLNSSGAVALFIYLLIAVSELRIRRRLDQAGTHLQVKMWAFPFLTYLSIAAMAAVILSMALKAESRLQLEFSLLSALALWIVYIVKHKRELATGLPVHEEL